MQRICSPLRSRCSCNYCFDFHTLMPENSFFQHVVRQTLSLNRAHSAWDFRFQDGADSWQPELEGSWTASLLRDSEMSWRERQVRECERSGPSQGYGVKIHLDFGDCDDRCQGQRKTQRSTGSCSQCHGRRSKSQFSDHLPCARYFPYFMVLVL